jgi:hypothetical protein
MINDVCIETITFEQMQLISGGNYQAPNSGYLEGGTPAGTIPFTPSQTEAYMKAMYTAAVSYQVEKSLLGNRRSWKDNEQMENILQYFTDCKREGRVYDWM